MGNITVATRTPGQWAPDETDAEMAARFQRDVIPFLDQLFGAAMRMTLQSADAEALALETIVRAYAGFRTFQRGTNLKGWLFRIQTKPSIPSRRAQTAPRATRAHP